MSICAKVQTVKLKGKTMSNVPEAPTSLQQIFAKAEKLALEGDTNAMIAFAIMEHSETMVKIAEQVTSVQLDGIQSAINSVARSV